LLELAARGSLVVRRYEFQHTETVRLLYASDLHLIRGTHHVVEQLLKRTDETEPDLVLLGGDLLDLWSGASLLKSLISNIPVPVWAISGNHDRIPGVARVRDAVEEVGGYWLEDTSTLCSGLRIDGVCRNDGAGSILCTHDPVVFPNAARAGYGLVLAGHLHGSQVVFAERSGKLYPGAWIYRWNGDFFQDGNCSMLVSRGVNDTLPIRWNCPRDIILCDFRKEK
jgi:uncharacterized protein